MSRITKRKSHRRAKTQKLQRRYKKPKIDDGIAMMAANVDETTWNYLPQHQKQLYRFRATQAMSIFRERTDGQ